MPKVDLKKSTKSKKSADFKSRKSNLGRGKHQHLSHTVIDLKTAKIKVPVQAKLEHEEVVAEGPTIQQLNDLISMAKSENPKKVLESVTSIQRIITKFPDFFVQHVSVVVTSVLQLIRHPDPKVRDATLNLFSWLFSRHASICTSFIPVFIRQIHVSLVSQSYAIQTCGAVLLERLSVLPNLLPLPSLFDVLALTLRGASSPESFVKFSGSVTKVLKRFATKSSKLGICEHNGFAFPSLFSENTVTYSQRLTDNCALEPDEVACLDEIGSILMEKATMLLDSENGDPTKSLCSLVMSIVAIYPQFNSEGLADIIAAHWPIEGAPLQHNLDEARILVRHQKYHQKIRDFLIGLDPSADFIALYATVALSGDKFDGFKSVPIVEETIRDICNSNISEAAGPSVAKAILEFIKAQEKITKRSLRALAAMPKDVEFQDGLIDLLSDKLVEASPTVADLLLNLAASSAPFQRKFAKDFAVFVSSDKVDDNLCGKCIEAFSTTNGKTEASILISFLLSVGTRRPSIASLVRAHLCRLRQLSSESEKSLYDSINSSTFTIK